MAARYFEFDQFRLTPESYELTRAGRPVRLEKIPFDLLVLFVERRRELVPRDEITAALWGSGTFQDLDQSLNTAIRKVRLALRDSADDPRFIQTVVGRGYRFLPDVITSERSDSTEPCAASPSPVPPTPTRHVPRLRPIALLAGLFALLIAGWLASRAPHESALIAVLPFDDLNGDPTQAYFSRGLTEEVITQLGRVAPTGFGVIAGPSVWRYRGTQVTSKKVPIPAISLWLLRLSQPRRARSYLFLLPGLARRRPQSILGSPFRPVRWPVSIRPLR